MMSAELPNQLRRVCTILRLKQSLQDAGLLGSANHIKLEQSISLLSPELCVRAFCFQIMTWLVAGLTD